MEHDLYGLIKIQHKFIQSHIKCAIKQLLEGICYMHQKDIIHRDLKCKTMGMTLYSSNTN